MGAQIGKIQEPLFVFLQILLQSSAEHIRVPTVHIIDLIKLLFVHHENVGDILVAHFAEHTVGAVFAFHLNIQFILNVRHRHAQLLGQLLGTLCLVLAGIDEILRKDAFRFFRGVVTRRVTSSDKTHYNGLQRQISFTHSFNLFSYRISCRKQTLLDGGFADAEFAGNIRHLHLVQIVEHHHLAIGFGEEGNLSEDTPQFFSLGGLLDELIDFIRLSRQGQFLVFDTHRLLCPTSLFGKIGIHTPCNRPHKGIEIVDVFLLMYGRNHCQNDVGAQILRLVGGVAPPIGVLIDLVEEDLLADKL